LKFCTHCFHVVADIGIYIAKPLIGIAIIIYFPKHNHYDYYGIYNFIGGVKGVKFRILFLYLKCIEIVYMVLRSGLRTLLNLFILKNPDSKIICTFRKT
jgi:hypothetical protein